MMITVRTADGGKITNDQWKIMFMQGVATAITEDMLKGGVIYINTHQVVDIRAATQEEIEHCKNHGW